MMLLQNGLLTLGLESGYRVILYEGGADLLGTCRKVIWNPGFQLPHSPRDNGSMYRNQTAACTVNKQLMLLFRRRMEEKSY